FDDLSHSGFGGQQQRGNRSGVLQSGAGDLGGIQHALLDQVAVLGGGGVVAGVVFAVGHVVDHDAGLVAGVGHDGTQRGFDSTQDQLDAGFLVDVVALDVGNGSLGADQRAAGAGQAAVFDGTHTRVQVAVNAGFIFLLSVFGGRTDADHRNAAGQLGHALLQLSAVVVGSGFCDLVVGLLDARLDR